MVMRTTAATNMTIAAAKKPQTAITKPMLNMEMPRITLG